jgi:hypothetical protein
LLLVDGFSAFRLVGAVDAVAGGLACKKLVRASAQAQAETKHDDPFHLHRVDSSEKFHYPDPNARPLCTITGDIK